MINCKSYLLTLILPATLMYGCSCSEEATPTKSNNNDSIDPIAVDNDTISPYDSIVIDTATIDTVAIDTIPTVNNEEQYFDPSTVVDNTKKNIKAAAITINVVIPFCICSLIMEGCVFNSLGCLS